MTPLLILVGAYLAGSVPFGLIVARLAKGIDIREHGSKNIGATNVTRVLGAKWGALCFVLDVLKGALPVLLPNVMLAANDPNRVHWQVAAGLLAILGHMFPIWLGFHGGKGVATALGVVVMLANPISTAITFGAFVVGFAVSRIVSISSIASATTFAVSQMWVLWPEPFGTATWSIATFSLAVPTLIIVKHRSNIGRLWRGEEPRFEFRRRKPSPEPPDNDTTPSARKGSGRGTVFFGILVAMWVAAMTWQRLVSHFPPDSLAAVSLPNESENGGFVSSKSCRACHPNEHASWHRSFHRTMTQVADERTIQAPFDHLELVSRGRTYQLERRGGEFWVNLVDPDVEKTYFVRGLNPNEIPNPPRVWRPVVMTTGSHHLQGYWVPSQKGLELHQLPFVFDLQDKRWMPVEDEFLRPPGEKRRFAVWNTSCIQCHAVAGQPRLNQRTDELWSSVAEFGIACESCHGPGTQHVARHSNPIERYQQHFAKTPDPTIVNPAHCDHRRSSEICGQCHSAFAPTNEAEWWREGYRFRAGDRIEESQHHFTFARTQTEKGEAEFFAQSYWPDGSNRVGGREYLAMTESVCFQKGELSCLSCHSMHQSDPDDQLAAHKQDNRACLPCHQQINDRLTEHTHHAPNSAGSSCYNCHMPHTSYALMKAIRAHRIDSPRVTVDTTSTRPNACNLCHLDQTLPWTQRWLRDWYGQPIHPLPEEASQSAASVRWLLKGNAVQRVVTAWHFGWEPALQASGRLWPAVLLTQALDDPYSVVRAVADRSLRRLLGTKTLDYDFLVPTDQRQAQQSVLLDQALQRLRTGQSSSSEVSRSAVQWRQLLLTSDGRILEDDLRALIRGRDDSDQELPE